MVLSQRQILLRQRMLETFSDKSRIKVSYQLLPSPFGWLGMIGHPEGMIALFREGRNRLRLLQKLRKRYPFAIQREEPVFRKSRRFLKNYFKGEKVAPPKVDWSSQSPFQKKVLRQVQKIPYGEVRSYAWLARKVGSFHGARACGQSLHDNPLPLLIPCHRVILKSGKTGGFIWGKRLKKRLLRLEQTS